jgi:hypothetical protein
MKGKKEREKREARKREKRKKQNKANNSVKVKGEGYHFFCLRLMLKLNAPECQKANPRVRIPSIQSKRNCFAIGLKIMSKHQQ